MEPLLERAGIARDAWPGLSAWLALLKQWNARIDLTAARSDEELVDLMIADAAFLAPRMPRHAPNAPRARIVDVGTGAGAPGLALAILRPDLKLTLVEPLAKRIAFLRTVIGTLKRTDIQLVNGRVEDFVGPTKNFDVAISRATLAPATWVPLGLSLAPATWALLAREEAPSVPGARLIEDVAYSWPLTGASRHAAQFATT